MKKNKVRKILIVVFIVTIFISGIYFFIPKMRHVPDVKSVSVFFYPLGVGDCEILLYNDNDKDFSSHIVYEITKSRTSLFYSSCKSRLHEGFYKITIEEKNKKSDYTISTKGIVYDVERDKYLKYDFIEDIYLYLAMQKLDEVVAKEENSEEYVRFYYEKPFSYLRK